MKVEQIIEGTVLLILVYLVVSNAFGFSQIVTSVGRVYTDAVRVLQGR